MLRVTKSQATEWEFLCSPEQRFFESLTEPAAICGGEPRYQCSFDVGCLHSDPDAAATILEGAHVKEWKGVETFCAKTRTRPVMELDGVLEEEVVHRYALLQALGRPMGFGLMRVRIQRYAWEHRRRQGIAIWLTGLTLMAWEGQIL